MSQRVLVFESDASFADEVKRNFERMGLAVDVAGDGPSGLELASARPPALILLAIELPGMNGFLVCKKIKKMADRCRAEEQSVVHTLMVRKAGVSSPWSAPAGG